MGEAAGIGPEITVKAWTALKDVGPCFFAVADPAVYRRLDVPLRLIEAPQEAPAAFPDALPILPLAPENATVVAIERAVSLACGGQASGVVTNPINKHALYEAGFKFPGHTEFIAHLCAAGPPLMMLMNDTLKVALVTIHLPLAKVPGALSTPAIIDCARRLSAALRADFAIAAPRLAVAALNPHGGESGALGREEIEIIQPAVRALSAQGLDIAGPLPADSLFHEAARARYDAVICLYHDQALIPLKTLDFHHGVNVTLGLPIVRTSPDHGTAYDIAGQGVASPHSLIAALRLARDIARRRAARS
jgi:4-hydroxythreonine-4-phosphate dehydrogenase